MVPWFAIVLLLAACDGVLREKPVNGDVDGGPLTLVPTPPCDRPVTPELNSGFCPMSSPGDDCLMCHHQGGMASPYTFAGTLFGSSGGAVAVSGATFHLIDALGTDVVVTSQANGNFFSVDLVTFPVVAFGSLCPNPVKPMVTPLRESDGSCNTSGCHTSGFRIHLP